jgi:hypothetical protein
MKRVGVPLLLVFALLAIAVAGYWLKRPAKAHAVVCPDPMAGCTFLHRGTAVKFLFSTRPKPLEPFELRISAPGATRISAAFQMNGMDMGFNRYDLRTAEEGTFTSKVTLPVCVSGRRDWTVYLDIDGSRYALPFSTQ